MTLDPDNNNRWLLLFAAILVVFFVTFSANTYSQIEPQEGEIVLDMASIDDIKFIVLARMHRRYPSATIRDIPINRMVDAWRTCGPDTRPIAIISQNPLAPMFLFCAEPPDKMINDIVVRKSWCSALNRIVSRYEGTRLYCKVSSRNIT